MYIGVIGSCVHMLSLNHVLGIRECTLILAMTQPQAKTQDNYLRIRKNLKGQGALPNSRIHQIAVHDRKNIEDSLPALVYTIQAFNIKSDPTFLSVGCLKRKSITYGNVPIYIFLFILFSFVTPSCTKTTEIPLRSLRPLHLLTIINFVLFVFQCLIWKVEMTVFPSAQFKSAQVISQEHEMTPKFQHCFFTSSVRLSPA